MVIKILYDFFNHYSYAFLTLISFYFFSEILVDIADGMERVDGKITEANEMVKVITKKESIWGNYKFRYLFLLVVYFYSELILYCKNLFLLQNFT